MDTRDDALRRLQGAWEELYEISEALGVWRAVRLLNGWTIIASSPEELRVLIARDYGVERIRSYRAAHR
jgi:hypothetical protein